MDEHTADTLHGLLEAFAIIQMVMTKPVSLEEMRTEVNDWITKLRKKIGRELDEFLNY